MEQQKLAICSLSLGWDPSHIFERKVSAIKAAGFQGIEIFMAEIDFSYAKVHNLSRIESARGIRKLCAEHGIEIGSLAAFSKFEGQPSPLEDRLKVAKEWLEVAKELGTTVIQIPSNDSKDALGDEDIVVSDLRALADLGLREDPPVSFAYEALAWSTHVADWEESLRIVQLVDRPNLGLCLDTFHVLSRLWADPRAHSGQELGATLLCETLYNAFVIAVRKKKIIYIQLSDAEKLSPPLLPGHPAYNEEWDGPHSWCNYGRLFPLESDKGAYLPVEEISRAWLVDSGWTGWVSMEIFHRDLKEAAKGPEYWAERGRESWDKLKGVLGKD